MKTSSKAIAQEVAIEKFLNEFEENVGKEFQGIEKKISSIEEKILSLDLDVEEARRSVRFHQRKTSESK
jgi:archaellum component FlaC